MGDPTQEEETSFLKVESMPFYGVASFLDSALGFAPIMPNLPDNPRQDLDRFLRAVKCTKPGDYNTTIPMSVAKGITKVLQNNPRLLRVGCGDCDTLWRWLVKNNYFRICLLISSLDKHNMWEIPINAVDPITGDSVLTDHRFIPSPKMLHMLITTGERMDFYNAETIENMLHVLVKKRPGSPDSNTAYDLLKSIVRICETIADTDLSYLNNLPDIDLPDRQNKRPLQIVLESGWMEMAELLVEKLGADFNCISCSSLPERAMNYIEKCKSLYTIKSNVTKIDEVEKECRLCCGAMESSEAYRLVGCCKKLMHSECLRKYLSRTDTPTCIFCNISRFEEDVLAAIPNTVYKSKWPRVRTYSEVVTARDTPENVFGFLKEIVVTHEDVSRVLQWHIPSVESDADESDHPVTALPFGRRVNSSASTIDASTSLGGLYPESGIWFSSFTDTQDADAIPVDFFPVSSIPRQPRALVFGSYGIDGTIRCCPSAEHTRRYSTIRMEDHIVYRNMVKNFEDENVSIAIARIYRQEYLSTITSPGAYKSIIGERMTRLLLDINNLVETADIHNSEGFNRFIDGVSNCIANNFFSGYNINLARGKFMQYIRRSLIERAQRNILIRILSAHQDTEFRDRLRGANTISSFYRSIWLRFREEHLSNNYALLYLSRSILSIGPIMGASDHERMFFMNNWVDDMLKIFSLVFNVVENLVK